MTTTQFLQARENMVQRQLRTWEVLDERVLQLVQTVPREAFVPTRLRCLAYVDVEIPLGHGQIMLTPKIEARILQAVNPKPSDTVLEIGTGTGYLTALLAKAARHVYSIDIFSEFTEAAASTLSAQAVTNVTLETGDAARGWDKHAPYDVIVITASLPLLDYQIQSSLRVGGRMFVIVGEAPAMEAVLITRLGDDEWARESLFETEAPPLINAPQPHGFEL